MRRRFLIYRSRFCLWVMFGLYAAVVLATLPHYGITWDEIFHYISGDIYLEYFRTTELKIESNSNLRYYGPAMDILGAVSDEQFHKQREWLEVDVARHLPATLIGIMIVPIVFWMVAAGAGRRAALFAAVAIALSPHYFSYVHNDPKDVGITVFFVGYLWAGMRRARGGSWVWGLAAAIFFGLGFATKLTIALAPAILLIWYLVQWPRRPPRGGARRWVERLAEVTLVIPAVGFLFGIALWPWMWVDTLHRVFLIFHHFQNVPWSGPVLYKGEVLMTNKLGYDYAITIFSIQNPIWILALAVLGGLGVLLRLRKKRRSVGQLALIGLAVTLGMATRTPGQTHDGLRQLLPILPLLSVLAGLGMERIWRWGLRWDRSRRLRGAWGGGRWIAASLLAGGAATVLYAMIALHPDQTAFFNAFVGGPAGADGRYEVEFYCNPYKRGMKWLGQNVEKSSTVAVPMNYYVAGYYNESGRIRAVGGEQMADYYMEMPRLYLDNIEKPEGLIEVYRIRAGGATVLTIYRFP